MTSDTLKTALGNAVQWLIETATIRDDRPPGEHGSKMPVTRWNGAMRGEYSVARKQWGCLCPIWHTGQAVKALVMAAKAVDRPDWLEAAKFNAEFIMNNRVTNGADQGLILAYEDHPDKVNTSAILECLDGLLHLADATGEEKYRAAVVEALQWIRDKAWDPQNKFFNDVYDPKAQKFLHNIRASQGRPLLDDAMFLRGWQLTGDDTFLQVAVQTAETLLRDESPAGNWVNYIPCNKEKGNIHPRQAYWWGRPMLDLYKATGEERFLECFLRSVEWYRQALRKDGGFIRHTYTDFNSDSFGHATSGTACAMIVFLDAFGHVGDETLLENVKQCMNYCMSMQFADPEDLNLKGCILEKVLPPNGSDRSPYHIRDLGTIFFVQAAARTLSETVAGRL